MKTAAISLLFAGLALAVPAVKQQKRALVTDVVIETVWTTTTLYVDPTAKAANFIEKPHSSPAAAAASASATPAPPAPVSVAPPAPSVAAPVPQAVQAAAVPAAPAAAAVPASGSGPSGTGEATWYDVSVGLGSCGLPKASNDDAVVALSIPKMANGANPNANPLCGKTIVINYNGQTHTAKVYDTCEGCAAGNIDLATNFFKQVFPAGDGRVPGVSWYVV